MLRIEHRDAGTSHVVGSHHIEKHVLHLEIVQRGSVHRGEQKCRPEALEHMAYHIPPVIEVNLRHTLCTLFITLQVSSRVRSCSQTTLGIFGAMWSLLLPDAASDEHN
jgi:hypothetical protein